MLFEKLTESQFLQEQIDYQAKRKPKYEPPCWGIGSPVGEDWEKFVEHHREQFNQHYENIERLVALGEEPDVEEVLKLWPNAPRLTDSEGIRADVVWRLKVEFDDGYWDIEYCFSKETLLELVEKI